MTGEEERIEIEIRKRNGESVPFQQEKIFNAMKKAFDGQGREIGGGELEEILATVLDNLSVTVPLTVERVQDEVERTLMERGYYEVAKPDGSSWLVRIPVYRSGSYQDRTGLCFIRKGT